MRLTCICIILCLPSLSAAQDADQLPIDQQAAVRTQQQTLLGEHELELSRFKRQALQSVAFSSGWLGSLSSDGLNSSSFSASIGSGIPLRSFENILGVTPGIQIDWIDAPSQFDIPSTLYLIETQFFYRRAINPRLSALAIVSPSIRSDFSTSDNAFRVFALGLLNWEYLQDELALSGGAVFLGRADLPVLPALGLSWTPHSRVKFDLRFPETRFAYRLRKNGRLSETWSSMAIGIGGNTWAVTRDTGLTDELSLRDIRLSLKLERLLDGGGGWYIESGYAFNRRIEYEQQASEVSLDDAMLIQAGWRY